MYHLLLQKTSNFMKKRVVCQKLTNSQDCCLCTLLFNLSKISLWNLLLKEMGKVNCFLLFIKPTIFALTWWSKSRWVSPMHVILELFWSSVFGVVLVGLCCCKSTTWQHEMIRKNSRSFQFDTNITSAYQRTSRTIYKVFQLIWFCLMSSHH